MNFRQDLLEILDVEITDEQLQTLNVYYQYLIEYNKTTNLTRITETDEVYYKHFYDSLTLAKTIDMKKIQTVCDMGSGAGFPSLPLKIIFPHLKITIVDSLNKRIIFLEKLVDKIGLTNVDLIHDRVEHYAKAYQAAFDLVTARALGSMSLISEMGIPMTKIGGYFIGLKGINYENEMIEAGHGIELLGGKISEIIKHELPHQYGTRFHIVIKKIKHVSGYPRQYAVMMKKAL